MRALLKTIVTIFCFTICISCKQKLKSSFIAKPIEREINSVKVIVDPNVEMMMIIGRLTRATPYNFENRMPIPYINDIDEYFEDFMNESAIIQTRKNSLNYDKLPEFGMNLTQDITGFKMKLDNKNFIIQTARNVSANKIPYYADREYIENVRDFRIKSKFDIFFINHTQEYEKIIDNYIEILKDYCFTKWIEEFYGVKIKKPLVLHLTYLTNGGNFSITINDKKGRKELHSVIAAGSNKNLFLRELSHEYSHYFTIKVSEKLYKNVKIEKFFNDLFNSYSIDYRKRGYDSGFLILNETLTQACANKYLEKIFSPYEVEKYNKEIIENQKWIYVSQIAEFLDKYENNRNKYKNLEDFSSELEEYILNIVSKKEVYK